MSVPKSFRQMAGIPASKVTASSGTTALIVIDPQKSYDTGSPLEISEINTRQKVISSVVDKYREAKAPVIWVQVSTQLANRRDDEDQLNTTY
jgi:nicotinamidase-related amidase